ncbi:MAG TPA: tetratricopeptide repeat protein [Streptosporangiaceae bacterium]
MAQARPTMTPTPAAVELRVLLRRLRRERGFSQRDLLGPLHLASHSAIADYESGRRIPAADILVGYEQIFGPVAAPLHELRQRVLAERAAAEAGRGASGQWLSALFGGEAPAMTGVIPMQLPADLADFTGRRNELAAAESRGPVTVVSGPPGIGKTVFAVRLGHRSRSRYPDGQLFADLRGHQPRSTDPGEIQGRFLRALGLPPSQVPSDPDERSALYRSLTAQQRLLVVLDNARDEAQVRVLLPTGPSCGVLITSRALLPGMEGATRIRLGVLPADDAIGFLTSIVGADRVDAEQQGAVRLTELCGKLPLAVRVAGARLAIRPDWRIADVIAMLTDEHARLDELVAGDLEVRAAFDVSYEMLDDQTRRVYRLIGVMPASSFTVASVAALTGLDQAQCGRIIESLVDLSLVEPLVPGRYRLHDLLRLYAAGRAMQEETQTERDAAVDRLLDWYLAVADVADRLIVPGRRRFSGPRSPHPEPGFGGREQAIRWCDDERAELAALTRTAAETGRHVLAWQLPDAVWGYFTLRRNWPDWLDMLTSGLASARTAGDWSGQASMLGTLGLVYLDLHRGEDATRCLQPFLAIAIAAGDTWAQALALIGLGLASRDLNQVDQAIDYLAKAAACGELSDPWSAGLAQLGLGLAYRDLRRPDESLPHLQSALEQFGAAQDRPGEVWVLQNLALTCQDLNQFEESESYLRQALVIRKELRDVKGEREVWLNLAALYQRLGQSAKEDEARTHAETIPVTRSAQGPTKKAHTNFSS